jgi:predicted RNA-binding Zn ribbon-like protein
MMDTLPNSTQDSEFDIDGDALCLDFANTLDWHESESPTEKLNTYHDLVRWGLEAGQLSQAQARSLEQGGSRDPQASAAVLAHAIDLREAIYRIFVAAAKQREIDPTDVRVLNRHLRFAMVNAELEEHDNRFSWSWVEQEAALDRMLWPVARSAADLLTSDQLDRVRQCEDDRGCGFLFIDFSRNKSRRWCSMESCGNRAKARRHYGRVRQK